MVNNKSKFTSARKSRQSRIGVAASGPTNLEDAVEDVSKVLLALQGFDLDKNDKDKAIFQRIVSG